MRQRFCFGVFLLLLSTTCDVLAADVKLGLANPLSGPLAVSGQRNETAVQLAVDAVNHAGGVLGRHVVLVTADDGCGTDEAVAAAEELVAAGVAAVVGHLCSHSSLLAAPVYEAADVPMLSPDSTHPRLTEEGRQNVFRLTGRDDEQGQVAANWLADLQPAPRIAITHDGSTYGQGLAERVRAQLRRRGAREVLFASYQQGTTDFHELVEQLLRLQVGVLYVGGYDPDAGRIVRAVRAAGSSLQLVGGDGLGGDEFWAEAGPDGEGALFTAARTEEAWASAEPVLAAFREAGLKPGPGGLGAYAAVQIWAEAVTRCDTLDPSAITAAIHRGRFATVIGPVAFTDKGDLTDRAWRWQVWHAGSYAPVPVAVSLR